MLCEEQEPEVIIVELGLTQEGCATPVPNWYGHHKQDETETLSFQSPLPGQLSLPHISRAVV